MIYQVWFIKKKLCTLFEIGTIVQKISILNKKIYHTAQPRSIESEWERENFDVSRNPIH